MNCKELDERTTRPNEILGFQEFCTRTANENKALFLKLNNIALQMNYFMLTNRFLPDSLAEEIACKNFEFAKQENKLDILNRIIK